MPQKNGNGNGHKPNSKVIPIGNRIVVRRNEGKRRAVLALNNPNCHILGDDFAQLTSDSMRGVYLVKTGSDEKGRDVVTENLAPILKNSSVTVKRVAMTDDSNGTSYHFLDLINDKGEIRPVVYTPRKFRDGSFENQLAGHTVRTTVKKHYERFPEFIEELTQAQNPLRQISKRAYGWHQLANGDYVFLLENGCETKHGFIEANAAPLFLDVDGGFGYTGAQAGKPGDAIMRLLLTKLNPHMSFDAILMALIGTSAHVSFIESKGPAPAVLEIFAPMRLGKSAIIDFILHLFTVSIPPLGTGAWQLPPVFNDFEDTIKGQGHLRAMFRGLPFQLPDLKAIDETADLRNDNRIKINEAYGDALSQGVTSSIDQTARSRKARAGAPIRTAEEDFATISIKRKKGSAEFRVNSFLWPRAEECDRDGCDCGLPRNEDGYIQSDENVSREIARRRAELYTWGFAYRHWQISLKPDQRRALYARCARQAENFVRKLWIAKEDGGLHQGFGVYVVTGLLLWRAFLNARFPRSFQLEWFSDVRLEDFVNNRHARTQWLIEQIKGNRQMTFHEFVPDAIRRILLNGDFYIADHNGEPLKDALDLPVNMVDLGYVPYGESWRPKKNILGYLHRSHQFISFQSDDFYRVLLAQAHADGIPIGLKKTSWEILCSYSVAVRPKANGHRFRTRIGKKLEQCIRIPVSIIWDIPDNPTNGEHLDEIETD